MDKQQITFEAIRMRDRRALRIALLILRWQPHESFLINRIVETLVADKRDRDTYVVDVGISKHRVQRHLAAAAPTPARNPTHGQVRPFRDQRSDSLRLIGGSLYADLSID